MGINGATNPEDQDAQDLFPHSKHCIESMRNSAVVEGRAVSCTCRANSRRHTFLYLLRRAKRMAYIDAYAKIRYQAKQRSERARTPAERHAFEEVASWAEALEFGHLDE